MGVLDIVLIGFILFGVVRGFYKGFFVEVASFVALVAGVYGALNFGDYAAEFLKSHTAWEEKTVSVVAFGVTFVVIVLVISIAGKALTKLASFAALGILNRILGALFGGLKLVLILSVALLVFHRMQDTVPLIEEKTLKDSMLYNPVKDFAPKLFPMITDYKEFLFEEKPAEVQESSKP